MAGKFGAAAPDANYQYAGKFLLEIDGISIMSFEKVKSGPAEWGVIEGRTGADRLQKVTSSGLKKPHVITCEKHLRVGGDSDISEILSWYESGSLDRRSGAIVLLDRDDNEVMRFTFENAWCQKYEGGELDATSENASMPFTFELNVMNYRQA